MSLNYKPSSNPLHISEAASHTGVPDIQRVLHARPGLQPETRNSGTFDVYYGIHRMAGHLTDLDVERTRHTYASQGQIMAWTRFERQRGRCRWRGRGREAARQREGGIERERGPGGLKRQIGRRNPKPCHQKPLPGEDITDQVSNPKPETLPHQCVGESEILVEQQLPQGFFVFDHACLVINEFSLRQAESQLPHNTVKLLF